MSGFIVVVVISELIVVVEESGLLGQFENVKNNVAVKKQANIIVITLFFINTPFF